MLTLEPRLTLETVTTLTAKNVSRRFRITGKGQIAMGYDADITLVDTDARFVLKREMLLDRHKLSPYVGREFRGQVKRTIVRGHTVFSMARPSVTFAGG